MIWKVLVVWLMVGALGCSSKPAVTGQDGGDPQASGVQQDQEAQRALGDDYSYDDVQDVGSDSMMGKAPVTRLEDERVPESLIIVEDDAHPTSVTERDRQQGLERDSEIVVTKTLPVFKDVYFDFDRRIPQDQMLQRLRGQANWLRANPETEVSVLGHCDIRGSREYNMVLGEKRAQWIKRFFMKQGIGEERISVISYGKEQPSCLKQTEGCHSKNRRAQLVLR